MIKDEYIPKTGILNLGNPIVKDYYDIWNSLDNRFNTTSLWELISKVNQCIRDTDHS
jgi:hypothetical protein